MEVYDVVVVIVGIETFSFFFGNVISLSVSVYRCWWLFWRVAIDVDVVIGFVPNIAKFVEVRLLVWLMLC